MGLHANGLMEFRTQHLEYRSIIVPTVRDLTGTFSWPQQNPFLPGNPETYLFVCLFFVRSLFCDSRGWRSRCETHRAGCRAGILWRSWSCRTQGEFPPLPGNLSSPRQAFQWTESDSAQMMGDNPLCLKPAGYEHHLQDIFTAIAGLGTSGTLAPGSLD